MKFIELLFGCKHEWEVVKGEEIYGLTKNRKNTKTKYPIIKLEISQCKKCGEVQKVGTIVTKNLFNHIVLQPI